MWNILSRVACQHNIRNNVSKSSITGKPRCLQIKGKSITWKQFKEAYNRDQSSFIIEHHFDLDSPTNRNHLAEDVLDSGTVDFLN